MPVNTEQIGKAIDCFVDDDYISSKEILQKEIKRAKNKYLKDKIGLEKDLDVEQENPTNEE
jgi:hypothetical protein